MGIEPIPLQNLPTQPLGPLNNTLTPLRTTSTLKRLVHLPLGAGVEERQGVTDLQSPVVDNTHLHARHVEVQRRLARVVAEDQVGVELDVAVAAGLHGGVGLFPGGGGGDFGEDGAGGERDFGDGAAGEGFGAADDAEETGVGWW